MDPTPQGYLSIGWMHEREWSKGTMVLIAYLSGTHGVGMDKLSCVDESCSLTTQRTQGMEELFTPIMHNINLNELQKVK